VNRDLEWGVRNGKYGVRGREAKSQKVRRWDRQRGSPRSESAVMKINRRPTQTHVDVFIKGFSVCVRLCVSAVNHIENSEYGMSGNRGNSKCKS
jgi:hypothetical protein